MRPQISWLEGLYKNKSKHLEWLQSQDMDKIKLGLERTEEILKLLGNPERKFNTIHVAGTNGKGSVCSILHSILSQRYKCGIYTSPALKRFNERIKINNQEIPDQEMEECIAEIREAVSGKNDDRKNIGFTFFEFSTALAFYYFAKKKVRYAVIETGMGGRNDSTNVITPVISIITSIGVDHTEFLGETKEIIAREKAGIIKKNIPVVVADKELFQEYKDEHDVSGPEVIVKRTSETLDGQDVIVNDKFSAHFPLIGDHQLLNLSLALTALKKSGIEISDHEIKDGIESVKWPGRFEVLNIKPKVIIDAAHNVEGIKALVRTLQKFAKEYVLVAGFSEGRNHEKMLKELSKVSKTVYVCQARYKGENCQKLANIAENYFNEVKVMEDPARAVKKAIKEKVKRGNENLCVTGSIYLLGEVAELLRSEFKC